MIFFFLNTRYGLRLYLTTFLCVGQKFFGLVVKDGISRQILLLRVLYDFKHSDLNL